MEAVRVQERLAPSAEEVQQAPEAAHTRPEEALRTGARPGAVEAPVRKAAAYG